MNPEKRLDSKFGFSLFYLLAERNFKAIAEKDTEHKSRKLFHSFYVCPGGRNGGFDKRVVEVFYGIRPVDFFFEYTHDKNCIPRLVRKLDIETGASIQYNYSVDGFVWCYLRPCNIQNSPHVIDYIIIDVISNAHKLTTDRMLQRHYKLFSSCHNVTSIDGTPSMMDRLRYSWMKYTHEISIEGIQKRPQIFKDVVKILHFALSIGLSGFLLKLIDFFYNSKSTISSVVWILCRP